MVFQFKSGHDSKTLNVLLSLVYAQTLETFPHLKRLKD